jgi:hypothetical protein
LDGLAIFQYDLRSGVFPRRLNRQSFYVTTISAPTSQGLKTFGRTESVQVGYISGPFEGLLEHDPWSEAKKLSAVPIEMALVKEPDL